MERVTDEKSILEMSLLELVYRSETSVRLRNCITTASRNGTCPFETINDYLKAGDSALREMRNVRHLGLRTANELHFLIKDVTKDVVAKVETHAGENIVSSDDASAAVYHWEGLTIAYDEPLLNDEIYSVLEESISVPQRLMNFFKIHQSEKEFPCHKVRDLVVGGECQISSLLRYPNLGRTSANALKSIIKMYLSPIKEEVLVKSNNLTEIILGITTQLNFKERLILQQRYGLGEERAKTLDEIGDLLGLTRERIRQIEKKALNKLRSKHLVAKVIEYLQDHQRDYFNSLADEDGILHNESLRLLPGEDMIAFDISYGSVQHWLQSFAVLFKRGWLLPETLSEEVKTCVSRVEDVLKNLPLPVPLGILCDIAGGTRHTLNISFALLEDFVLFEEMVFPPRIGPRKRRLARLYAILSSSNFKQIENLVELHNGLFASEKCTTRDGQIVMCDAPHLFISLNEFGWATLGIKPPANVKPAIYPMDSAISDDGDEKGLADEGSVNAVSSIRRILEEEGPLHFVALRDIFIEDGYAASSLGPLLLGCDDFVRLAPGTYGLRCHTGLDYCSIYKAILLNEDDVALYVMSRWAGEPLYTYPWWTPTMEFEWSKWAQRRANPFLFSSLMAVADPTTWPISHEELQHWLYIKGKHGHYSLQCDHKHELADSVPTIRELYALMVVAAGASLNWVRVNRILGRRINDQHSASYLALLICLEAIEPCDHWQAQHLPTADLPELISQLSLELLKDSNPSWTSDAGGALLAKINISIRSLALGWVLRPEVSSLVDVLTRQHSGYQPPEEPICCELEKMLSCKDEDDESDLFNDLIAELVGDDSPGE